MGRSADRPLDPLATHNRLALGDQWSCIRGLAAHGLGLFNLVEGLVDHHILGIYHVRETGNQTAWDLAFLAFGTLLAIAGWALVRPESRERPVARP